MASAQEDEIVIGNDTTSGGNFIDGHHPSLHINEGGSGVVLDNVELRAANGRMLQTTPRVANGSFENPVVTTFSLVTTLPGWTVVKGPTLLQQVHIRWT